MYKIFFWLSMMLLCFGETTEAQFLPPDQPEQDACNALLLCGTSFYSPYTYQGYGYVHDLINTPCSAPNLPADEYNSVWLKLIINTPGILVFNITPVAVQDDYDWAVLNMTNKSCQNITASDVVRCNFNNNQPISNNGITGLSLTATETGVESGTTGHPYCKFIDAQAGQVYLIMVNNFGVLGQGLTSGFTIDFAGSTATFNTGDAPEFESIVPSCTLSQKVTLKLSKPVACNSIATDGSDFFLSPSGNITGAHGVNCNAVGQGYTDKVEITFGPALSPGNYILHAQTGTDGNTLLDLCTNPLALPDALPFTVPKLKEEVNLTVCTNQLPYSWNGISVSNGGPDAAQATFPNQNGCDSVVTLNLTVTDTIRHIDTVTICPNDLPYIWNGITVTNEGTNAAQFYAVAAGGCDSITTLNLIVQHAHPETYALDGCGSLTFNDKTYTQSQSNVKDTILSIGGCDSVYATLNIIIHPLNPSVDSVLKAGCGFVDFNNHHYTESEILRDTIFNQFGCDSVYKIVNIVVYPDIPAKVTHDIADCDSVLFEGHTYTTETTLVDTFQNILGCDSLVRTVNIHPQHFALSLLADPEHPVKGVYLILKTQSNIPGYQVLSWSPEAVFPNQIALEQHLLATVSTIYKAVGQTGLGCIDTAVLDLKVDSLIPVAIMPSAFSPNGDGLNDVFKPNFVNKSGYKINAFKVFNRYGQIIFSAGGVSDAGWNGCYFNGDKRADQGVYFYFIEIEFVDGEKLPIKGDVTLIR